MGRHGGPDPWKDAVELIVRHAGPRLVVGAPLGLGKPHGLLNALYRRVEADPALSMHLLTALSLTPPNPGSGLQRRFLEPFLARQYGEDFEALSHVGAQLKDALPANVRIEEFYLQSGLLLASSEAQRHYVSVNYTHAARALAERGVNVVVQWVAPEPGGERFSLSCNPDLTLDLLDELERLGKPKPLLVAAIHPDLPWLQGDAVVDAGFFDHVVPPQSPAARLFGLPRQPVNDADYAIGLHASRLVRDGGTLQIGIGALSDALCRALVMRQQDNPAYRQALAAIDGDAPCHPVCADWGGTEPFVQGLFGASEMITDGFQQLVDAGVLGRKVVDDIELMQRATRADCSEADRARISEEGTFLQAAFYLGSNDFYRWLRELPDDLRQGIRMCRVSRINQLYGGTEALDKLQRRDARFFNTAMIMNLLGAATSDALDDGRVVSGVGGQYNFVAMAHALDEGRSVLMLRATRDSGGKTHSNIRWNYGHTTIPRHLRDIVVTEYGIADLRGRNDEECIKAMLAISDARFQAGLIEDAKSSGKLAADFRAPAHWSANRPEVVTKDLAPFRNEPQLADYPMGSDFTVVEQRLVRALAWLKEHTATRIGALRTTAAALLAGREADIDRQALQRMDLVDPQGISQRVEARLLAMALARTRRPSG
jgi:acyl-CoA hydrolase